MLQLKVLVLHCTQQDTNIPPAGGVSAFGWIYESLARAVGVYAAINGCSEKVSLTPRCTMSARATHSTWQLSDVVVCDMLPRQPQQHDDQQPLWSCVQQYRG